MNDQENEGWFVLGLIIGLIVAWLANYSVVTAHWRHDCINHNIGYYNVTNGQFYLKTITNAVDIEQK